MASLTDFSVSKLAVPDRGQKLYPDGVVTGLYVRVSQGGSKTFVFVEGKERRFRSLGRYGDVTLAQARQAVRTLRAERTLGRLLPSTVSVETARKEYLSQITVRPSTRGYYQRYLAKLSGRLTDITGRDINTLLDQLTPASRLQALRSYTAFFSWCIQKHYLDTSPCARIKAEQSSSRARVLSEPELKAIWDASQDCGRFGSIVRLLILTGQRRGEIAALHPAYLDFEKRTLCLPSDLTKNGREHLLPIGVLAADELLKVATHVTVSAFTFPARGRVNSPFSGWSTSKKQIDRLSKVESWTLHDLRRTFASIHARIGTPIHIIEKMLNHRSGTFGGIVSVYQRYDFAKEMTAAAEQYENEIKRIVE